jgi:hypothetical protein
MISANTLPGTAVVALDDGGSDGLPFLTVGAVYRVREMGLSFTGIVGVILEECSDYHDVVHRDWYRPWRPYCLQYERTSFELASLPRTITDLLTETKIKEPA